VPQETEQELLERARAGDRAAFDRLQRLLDLPVRRFVSRLLGRGDAADDLVPRVMLALYNNLQRIEGAEGLRPFVFRVVRNLCYDELRRKGRFQTVSLDSLTETGSTLRGTLPDRRPSPEDLATWTLLHAEVQRAMDRLPEPQRQALILHCEQELSQPQVAEAMGVDLGTVKSRIHYARKNLEKLLPPDLLRALDLKKGPSDD
jgi:RNA polymerase sigma factor (sigma-70 family)